MPDPIIDETNKADWDALGIEPFDTDTEHVGPEEKPAPALAPAPAPSQAMRMPLPSNPLPMTFIFGIVPNNGKPVIFCTAVNDSGSMTQGYLVPDVALKLGRDLLKVGRAAFEVGENEKHLTVVSKKGLLLPR